MSENKIEQRCFESINKNFGIGKPGTHQRTCDICGMTFDEPNDLNVLIASGPYECPQCKAINDLKKTLIQHYHKYLLIEDDNDLQNNQLQKNDSQLSYSYTETYEFENRTKTIKDIIKIILKARNYIYFELNPYIKILESLYVKNDIFWGELGNAWCYLIDSVIQSTVIRINEFIDSDSSFCIKKIINRFAHNKTALFDKHKTIVIRHIEPGGIIKKSLYPRFPIEDYFIKIQNVLFSYSSTIKAIERARDERFAHIDVSKLEKPCLDKVSFNDLKRIFESLKIIYDGFLYSIAPDQYKIMEIDHNMWFGHMNDMAIFWKKYHTKK